ncbi:MAG: CCA tRNA nucleotidyltransferase [Parvibaculales bacterium]
MTAPVMRPGWLVRPQTKKLFDVLGEPNLRAVGGCVRDSLRSQATDTEQQNVDIDMATPLVPETVMAQLTQAGVKVVPTGLKYGTVTAILDGFHYEITTLRQDVATDGRHARVAYGEDWCVDAGRRDFTVNALYCDAGGCVHDPLGTGLADLQAGRVVFIGDAGTRIREDYLRVFRFFRFHALMGEGTPDETALAACQAAAREGAGLEKLSGERLQQEILKILAMPNPASTLEIMQKTGVLAYALPLDEVRTGLSRLRGLAGFDAAVEQLDPIVRLSAVMAHKPDQAERVMRHLRLSNRDRDRIETLLSGPYRDVIVTQDNLVQLAYRLGVQVCLDRLLLQTSAETAPDLKALRTAIAGLGRLTLPVFPVSGKTLLAAGFEAGPDMGRLLSALEDWWVDNGFKGDEPALLARLNEMVDSADTD